MSPFAGSACTATPDRPLAGQTILAVEDSRFACEALRLLCRRSGARLLRADSLAAAERQLARARPDMALVDLGLPDGRGETLIRALAADRPRVGLVVAMSGEDAARERALAAGADAFLAKPIASLAAFQDALAGAIPAGAHGGAPSREALRPDPLAARDDLARLGRALAAGPDDVELGYLAGFAAGLARSTEDAALAEAADELARRRASCQTTEPTRLYLAALIEARLARPGGVAA